MYRISDISGFRKRFTVYLCRNFAALIALQLVNDRFDIILVKMRQIQFDIIQKFIALNSALQGSAHHSSEELGNDQQ